MVRCCNGEHDNRASPMDHWLTVSEAATALGISVPTLYGWLSSSDTGEFQIRGQPLTIDYLQGGARGQGRIRIATSEIERLQEAMRVRPRPKTGRHLPAKPRAYPGITVPLGRPTN